MGCLLTLFTLRDLITDMEPNNLRGKLQAGVFQVQGKLVKRTSQVFCYFWLYQKWACFSMYEGKKRDGEMTFLHHNLMTLWNISHQGEQPLDPFLYHFLPAFSIFSRVRWVWHSLTSSGGCSHLLCTVTNWDAERWRAYRAVCGTSLLLILKVACPAGSHPALLWAG